MLKRLLLPALLAVTSVAAFADGPATQGSLSMLVVRYAAALPGVPSLSPAREFAQVWISTTDDTVDTFDVTVAYTLEDESGTKQLTIDRLRTEDWYSVATVEIPLNAAITSVTVTTPNDTQQFPGPNAPPPDSPPED